MSVEVNNPSGDGMATAVASRHGLDLHGLSPAHAVHWNLSPARLYEESLRRGEGRLAHMGGFSTVTAPTTGRSPNDKYTVRESSTADDIHWGKINVEVSPDQFESLRAEVVAHLNEHELFVRDARAGEDPEAGIDVRVVTTSAWHNLFAYNMFLRPDPDTLAEHEPEFTVLHCPGLKVEPKAHGIRSHTFVVVNFERREVLIGGTRYAGEIKKSIFSVLNYLLPGRGILPMHCSANVGDGGDVALFFGLSGTGKTTLSADPERGLIGDDEHGWGEGGVFNFEGGCYAKVIDLSPDGEPEIHAATQKFGTILENVVLDEANRAIEFENGSITQNTRASYPIHYIPNAVEPSRGDHPSTVIFLTCDAFGVLPPVSKLTPEQAMYHFLSGYTAKVAGTERGITEPKAAFSACFGSPFLPRHPSVYARLLGERLREHGASTWLINTGWSGGGHGVGSRISLKFTRAMVRAALRGDLDSVETRTDPVFGLHIPVSVEGVPAKLLTPRATWADVDSYDAAASRLADMFRDNFVQYEDEISDEVKAAGPR